MASSAGTSTGTIALATTRAGVVVLSAVASTVGNIAAAAASAVAVLGLSAGVVALPTVGAVGVAWAQSAAPDETLWVPVATGALMLHLYDATQEYSPRRA